MPEIVPFSLSTASNSTPRGFGIHIPVEDDILYIRPCSSPTCNPAPTFAVHLSSDLALEENVYNISYVLKYGPTVLLVYGHSYFHVHLS